MTEKAIPDWVESLEHLTNVMTSAVVVVEALVKLRENTSDDEFDKFFDNKFLGELIDQATELEDEMMNKELIHRFNIVT